MNARKYLDAAQEQAETDETMSNRGARRQMRLVSALRAVLDQCEVVEYVKPVDEYQRGVGMEASAIRTLIESKLGGES